MPDFDTRKPQETNEPDRFRVTLLANGLSRLLSASKLRIRSIADALRRSLLANRLFTSWLGAVLLLVITAASVGLIVSSYGGFDHQQQEAISYSNAEMVFGTRDSGLWTMNADGSNQTQLLDSAASDPAWSPDGTEIAFTYMSFRRRCDGYCDTTVRTTDVYKMDANGCGKSRLTPADPDDEHPEHSAAWSSDGEQIAYVRGSSASSAIYKVNADGCDPTNLRGADLSEADLRGANLLNDDLRKAKMNGANLSGADIRATAADAELRGANLTDANLWGADLTRADLQGAELRGADLRGATLDGARIVLPDEATVRVPAWEAQARGQLEDLYATLTSCLDTIHVEKRDPHVTTETIRDVKIIRCTETSHDEVFKLYEDDLRPNVGWNMYEKTHRVGNASYGTGEVVITAQHSFGGSAYQTSTATNGRIERIPRY